MISVTQWGQRRNGELLANEVERRTLPATTFFVPLSLAHGSLARPMRNRFDQFAKLMTREGYAPAGAVETDAEVSPDAARIDVWFTPNPALRASTLAHLGLLGRLARTA